MCVLSLLFTSVIFYYFKIYLSDRVNHPPTATKWGLDIVRLKSALAYKVVVVAAAKVITHLAITL